MKALLKKGLAAFQAAPAAALAVPKPDRSLVYAPPEGGLVLAVTSKILAGYEPGGSPEIRRFQESLGRDTLWLRKDEHEALAKGEVPVSLQKRLAKFNLIDNTRGEPAPWDEKEIRALSMTLKDGVVTGSAHLESADGKRALKMSLRGAVETKDGRVTRFDLVALGEGRGWSGTTEAAAPKGAFTLAVALRLASGTDEADRISPQGAKSWLPDYLR